MSGTERIHKLLFCFDFDESLTNRHIHSYSEIVPSIFKFPNEIIALWEAAHRAGHKIAITTNNDPEIITWALEVMVPKPANILQHMAIVCLPKSADKNTHVTKAYIAHGISPHIYKAVVIDDMPQNIEAALRFGHYGICVHKPNPEMAELNINKNMSHLHTIFAILKKPYPSNMLEICSNHNATLGIVSPQCSRQA